MRVRFRFALFAVFLISSQASAQSWCPPGAEWSFLYGTLDWTNGATTSGYSHARYVGDTLLGGVMAQQIDLDVHYQEEGMGEYIHLPWGSTITHYADGVVYGWRTVEQQYDTLLWFQGVPGDEWPVFGLSSYYRFVVLDTAMVDIDGFVLRRSAVEMRFYDDAIYVDTLYERIGFTWLNSFGPGGVLADGVHVTFNCYRDDLFSYMGETVTECGYTVSTAENEAPEQLSIAPNPGTDNMLVRWNNWTNDPGTIRVRDVQGRSVGSWTLSNGSTNVNVATWSPGVYNVEFTHGAVRSVRRWVKL